MRDKKTGIKRITIRGKQINKEIEDSTTYFSHKKEQDVMKREYQGIRKSYRK